MGAYGATRSNGLLFLVYNSRRDTAPLLSLLLTDSLSAMPSQIDVYSKSAPMSLSTGLPSVILQITLSRSFIYSVGSICALRSCCFNMRFTTLTTTCHRWEFFTTLEFEWEVFTGRRPWKWSFAVYLLARMLAFTSIILNFIGFNVTTEFNCNVSGRLRVPSFDTDEPDLHRPGSVVSLPHHGLRWQLHRSFLRFVGE